MTPPRSQRGDLQALLGTAQSFRYVEGAEALRYFGPAPLDKPVLREIGIGRLQRTS